MEIKDLAISPDIVNLFDYTQNDDARYCLAKIMLTPLPDKASVVERQAILKGFVSNSNVFQNYTYSRIDYREANYFIEKFTEEVYLPKRIKTKLRLYKKLYYEYRGKFIQVILLHNRLHSFIKNLPTMVFPDSYKKELLFMDDYLNYLRLDYYEGFIREGNIRTKHLIEFFRLISDIKNKKRDIAFREMHARFEAYISIALGTRLHGFSFPEITEIKLALADFYHPLLKTPVKNSFTANTNVVLLTGPNMSGKSTLLKAIGICVYLANIGCAVPASAGEVPYYKNIDIFINLNDDLQSGYSHFMTEIMNLKNVIKESETKKGFAIFDELFRGTNIDDALEISRSTLKGMLNFPESLFFVSSHLHQLIEMEEIKKGTISCFYLDCNLENSTPTFTYHLKEGTSNIKIGRILFEKENMNRLLKLN